ncbi:MAG: T9SS type A sorting domain-containing protein [Flavobacteriaceae bacterium]|nr:T9SS type A sorting domain-containing protein [Flavobacteriaceae bacterium]
METTTLTSCNESSIIPSFHQEDISNLSSGLLFVQIQTQDGSIIKKVLKE